MIKLSSCTICNLVDKKSVSSSKTEQMSNLKTIVLLILKLGRASRYRMSGRRVLCMNSRQV